MCPTSGSLGRKGKVDDGNKTYICADDEDSVIPDTWRKRSPDIEGGEVAVQGRAGLHKSASESGASRSGGFGE